jgi:hypothetical protein
MHTLNPTSILRVSRALRNGSPSRNQIEKIRHRLHTDNETGLLVRRSPNSRKKGQEIFAPKGDASTTVTRYTNRKAERAAPYRAGIKVRRARATRPNTHAR